jgi:hypothetical protein
VTAPSSAPTAAHENSYAQSAGSWNIGDAVSVAVTYVNARGETTPSPWSSAITVADIRSYGWPGPSMPEALYVGLPVSGDGSVTAKRIYVSVNGAGRGYLEIANATTSVLFSGSGGWASPPTVNTAVLTGPVNAVQVTGLGLGPAGTTQRKVYRTAVNGTQLKFHTTVPNNTATTLAANDTTPDGSLGANAPTVDTSGLAGSVVAGSVLAGSPSLLTSGAGAFSPSGGWALVGQDAIRYTGITGNTLTGIPPTGPGAIVTTILYGAPILSAPALLGVSTGQAADTPSVSVAPAVGATTEIYAGWFSSAWDMGANAPYPFTNGSGDRSWAYTFVTAFGETAPSPRLTRTTPNAFGPHKCLLVIPVGPPGTIARKVYRTAPFDSVLRLTKTLADNTTTLCPDDTTDVALGAIAPPDGTMRVPLGVALGKGALVSIWVQRDDLAAQAAQAIIDTASGVVPADGIYEVAPIVDERRNESSLTAVCDATLAQYSRSLVTVTYACRDVKTKSGRPITIDQTTPPIQATLTIQEVTITEIDSAPGLAPRFSVTASNIRLSLDGLIRSLLAGAA